MTTTPRKRPTPLPLLPCTCANLRRAARAVTRLYNGELQRDGIEVTQFTLLMALNKTGAIPQGALGRLLALDSTTLTRMLDLMKRRGWVQAKEGDDRRLRIFSLTRAGRAKYLRGLPHWKRAQDRLRSALGETAASRLSELLADVTGAALQE
ncbi:MAG TPA: MarR family transcriptional regulator [Terriglobia bacterium]|nr:MarR family transcriptional regulator [Terriglobia bacterium]